MASKMIGRTACPECGFESAHVKESEKCLYRYCPECSSQHHAKTSRQRADLLAKTRLIEDAGKAVEQAAPEPTPTPTPTGAMDVQPTATPTQEPKQAAPKRRGLFG